jgi:hypothetical protein
MVFYPFGALQITNYDFVLQSLFSFPKNPFPNVVQNFMDIIGSLLGVTRRPRIPSYLVSNCIALPLLFCLLEAFWFMIPCNLYSSFLLIIQFFNYFVLSLVMKHFGGKK